MAEENDFTRVWVETHSFQGYTKLPTHQVEHALRTHLQHTDLQSSTPAQERPPAQSTPPPDASHQQAAPPHEHPDWAPALLEMRHQRTGWNDQHQWNEYYTDPARKALLDPAARQEQASSITSPDTSSSHQLATTSSSQLAT